MARFKKNAKNQILFNLTKSGDGSFAKGAVASDVSIAVPYYIGVAAGSAVASKGNISIMPSLVQSGIFRATLKAAECNFDMAMYCFDGTSTALQIVPVVFDTDNDVMIYSRVSDVQSQAVMAASAAKQGNSRALVTQSLASDVHSNVVLATSAARKGASQAVKGYSATLLTQSLTSDAVSQTILATSAARKGFSQAVKSYSGVLLTQSLTSDVHSQTVLAISAARKGYSQAIKSYSAALLTQSLASNTHSQAARTYSAVKSLTVALADSDISQISEEVASAVGAGVASQVWAYSDASQCLSAAKAATGANASTIWTYSNASQCLSQTIQGNSRASTAATLASQATVEADAAYSAASTAATAAIAAASSASDAQSAIIAAALLLYGQGAVIQSLVSDAVSQATRTYSAVQLVKSLASDTVSQAERTYSAVQLVKSLASDAHSQAARTYSRVIAGVTLTTSHLGSVADKLLGRAVQGGADGGRTVKQALFTLRNKVIMNADSTVDVMDETDASVAWSATYSTAAGNPIVKVDP